APVHASAQLRALKDRSRAVHPRVVREGDWASVHFIPIPMHPFFAKHAMRPQNHCPRALELYPRLVSLPLYPSMTEEQVDFVVGAVKEILLGTRKKTSVALATHEVGAPSA